MYQVPALVLLASMTHIVVAASSTASDPEECHALEGQSQLTEDTTQLLQVRSHADGSNAASMEENAKSMNQFTVICNGFGVNPHTKSASKLSEFGSCLTDAGKVYSLVDDDNGLLKGINVDDKAEISILQTAESEYDRRLYKVLSIKILNALPKDDDAEIDERPVSGEVSVSSSTTTTLTTTTTTTTSTTSTTTTSTTTTTKTTSTKSTTTTSTTTTSTTTSTTPAPTVAKKTTPAPHKRIKWLPWIR